MRSAPPRVRPEAGTGPRILNIKRDHAKHNQAGFFLTNEKMETSVPGLYVIGDIRVQPVRQIANAAADGTVAAVMAQMYLEQRHLLVRGR